jgi:hypothetical protein
MVLQNDVKRTDTVFQYTTVNSLGCDIHSEAYGLLDGVGYVGFELHHTFLWILHASVRWLTIPSGEGHIAEVG